MVQISGEVLGNHTGILLARPQNSDLALIRCWPPIGLPGFIVIGHEVPGCLSFAVELPQDVELVKREAQKKESDGDYPALLDSSK